MPIYYFLPQPVFSYTHIHRLIRLASHTKKESNRWRKGDDKAAATPLLYETGFHVPYKITTVLFAQSTKESFISDLELHTLMRTETSADLFHTKAATPQGFLSSGKRGVEKIIPALCVRVCVCWWTSFKSGIWSQCYITCICIWSMKWSDWLHELLQMPKYLVCIYKRTYYIINACNQKRKHCWTQVELIFYSRHGHKAALQNSGCSLIFRYLMSNTEVRVMGRKIPEVTQGIG